MYDRIGNSFLFVFETGATESLKPFELDRGCFGTIIVPPGSDAIGKTLQFVALPEKYDQDSFPETELLTAGKLLAAGANPITSDEITEIGAAKKTRLRLDAAVAAETKIWLLWKS